VKDSVFTARIEKYEEQMVIKLYASASPTSRSRQKKTNKTKQLRKNSATLPILSLAVKTYPGLILITKTQEQPE